LFYTVVNWCAGSELKTLPAVEIKIKEKQKK
jgi:hypothetical protein